VSVRGSITTEADVLRDLEDRVRVLESRKWLDGVVSVRGLRLGGFVLEVDPVNGDLQARRLTDDATATILAAS
jgi:hypothetical protein